MEIADIQKLEEILPIYKKNRTKGMNAGHISDQTGIPLKDVISFLIEKKVLSGEQVDLELVRVMITRNPELKKAFTGKSGSSLTELDLALATDDSNALRKMGYQSEYEQAFSVIPQFIVVGGLINLSLDMIFGLCMTVAGLILMQILQRYNSKSSIEIVTKILGDC